MRRRTVQGVGTNDANYPVGQGKCHFYTIWLAIINRCYSPTLLKRDPNYIGCSVTDEWHLFSNFKKWMIQQDWEGKVLDKDLKVLGNKVYGPDTCLFITQKINTLINKQPNQRGDLPIGVARHMDKYKVTMKMDRKTHHIGVFPSIETAAFAYKTAKANWIEHHAHGEKCPETKAALHRVADYYRKVML